jgi:hypothetical protein
MNQNSTLSPLFEKNIYKVQIKNFVSYLAIQIHSLSHSTNSRQKKRDSLKLRFFECRVETKI